MAAWIQLLPTLQLFRHKTEGQLSVQVSSTSPSLAPSSVPCPAHPCACLPLASLQEWSGWASALSWLRVWLAPEFQHSIRGRRGQRDEGPVIQEVIRLFISKTLTPTFSAVWTQKTNNDPGLGASSIRRQERVLPVQTSLQVKTLVLSKSYSITTALPVPGTSIHSSVGLLLYQQPGPGCDQA